MHAKLQSLGLIHQVDVIHTDNVGKFLQGYDKLTSRAENFSPAIGRGIDSRNRVWN
jgi:hypothetical protein